MRVQPVDHPGNTRRITRLDDVTRKIAEPKITPVRSDMLAKVDARVLRSSPEPADAPILEEPTGDEGKVPGVIRLLEAGHFKGVADVRLRINFFDELSARAQAAAVPVVERESSELLTAITAKVDELVTALAVDDEVQEAVAGLVEGFNAAVQAAVDEATSGGAIQTEGLITAIQAAFEVLKERLTELLDASLTEPQPPVDRDVTPPDPAVDRSRLSSRDTKADRAAPGEPVDDRLSATDATRITLQSDGDLVRPDEPLDTPDGATDDPALTLDDAVTLLTDAFQEALSALLASINQAAQLPDPSPPSGNGVAYDKFLAIYNDLRDTALTLDEQV